MVDPISTRPTLPLPAAAAEQLAQSNASSVAASAAAARAATTVQAPAAEVGSVARTLAAQPPVNTDKVMEIRAAIRSGNYPVEPYTIAESMIRSLRG